MKIKTEYLPAQFFEGVERTVKEQWVDPRDIEDVELSLAYHNVVNAYEKFRDLVTDFQDAIDAIEETLM